MFRRLLSIILLCLPLTAGAADEARVADVAGGEVILEFDVMPAFAVGDTLELSYQAGFMDMLLGSYRLRERRGNRLILSTLSTSNPPSKGMRVGVHKATPILFSGQPAPEVPPLSASQAPSPAAPGAGRVAAVRGGEVELAFPPGTSVRVGDRFSLAFEAPRVGRVPIQGVWQVRRVDGDRAHAEAEGGAGQARAGQVAIPVAAAAPGVTAPPSLPPPPGPDPGSGLFPNPPLMSFEEYLRQTPVPPASVPSPVPGPTQAPITAASWIGLHMQGLTPELAQTLNLPPATMGILVADVVPGGPAERAGLQPGDVILDVDGRGMAPHQLADRVRQSAPGTLLRLRILRGGSRMFIAVRTAAKP